MIFPPQHPAPYTPVRIMAIDPGTKKQGFCILDLYERGDISKVVVECFTNDSSNYLRAHSHEEAFYGSRRIRIRQQADTLYRALQQYKPSILIVEAPFMGRFAQSFEALVELRSALRTALMEYDPWMPFETIEPTPVKSFLGAIIKGDTKNSVRDKLLSRADINWAPHISPTELDEHSIDATAIATWRANKFLTDGF